MMRVGQLIDQLKLVDPNWEVAFAHPEDPESVCEIDRLSTDADIYGPKTIVLTHNG